MRNELIDEIVRETGLKRPTIHARLRKCKQRQIDCDTLFAPVLLRAGRKRCNIAGFDVFAIADRLGMTSTAIRYRIRQYLAGEITREQVEMGKHSGRTADGEPTVLLRCSHDGGNAEWAALSDKPRKAADKTGSVRWTS